MITPKLIGAALCSAASLCCLAVQAADDAAAKPKVVVSKLDNPCGVAVHPKTGQLFVAAHPAVYRVIPGQPTKVTIEVEGFKTDIYGKGPKYEIGPLGVGFIGDELLVVGDGSLPDGQELARVYKIGDTPAEKPQSADAMAHKLGPIAPGDESAKGEGNFYGVAVTKDAVFFTSNGDDTKGWILKSEIKDGKPGELKPFIATKVAVKVDAPVGITTSKDGKELVVGQMGEISLPGDSLLSTYDPATGKLLKNYKTGLNDIAGLAYSPKTGKLYAVDYSWADTSKGGLFRLDIDGDKVKATKITSLDKPSALAFDKDGNLYITVLGTAPEGSTDLPGALLRIEAGL